MPAPQDQAPWDYAQPHRDAIRVRGLIPWIARKATESSARLFRHRRVDERTLSWLTAIQRLPSRRQCRVQHLSNEHEERLSADAANDVALLLTRF